MKAKLDIHGSEERLRRAEEKLHNPMFLRNEELIEAFRRHRHLKG